MGIFGKRCHPASRRLYRVPDDGRQEIIPFDFQDDSGIRRGNGDAVRIQKVNAAQAGADIAGLNLELFETNSLAKLRLHAWIAENVKIFGDGELAIVAIPKAVEERLGVTDAELGNLSSYARSIEGVCLAATLRQGKYGETKISIRAVPGWDAAAVCERFGGGGHPGAGGATTRMSLEDTAKLLEEYMLEA